MKHEDLYETTWEMARRIRDTRLYLAIKPDVELEAAMQ